MMDFSMVDVVFLMQHCEMIVWCRLKIYSAEGSSRLPVLV